MENSALDKLAIVEALLFAANKGLEIGQLTDFASCPKNEILSILEELKEKYSTEGHGVELKKVGKKYGFYTKPKYSENVSRLVRKPIEKLTSSQIEVLAVIAKNGPVKKSQIELIRGKASDNQVVELMLSGLIKRKRIKGPGRPYAYFVTDSFFETFHLADFEIPRDSLFEDEEPEETNDDESVESDCTQSVESECTQSVGSECTQSVGSEDTMKEPTEEKSEAGVSLAAMIAPDSNNDNTGDDTAYHTADNSDEHKPENDMPYAPEEAEIKE